MLDTSLTGASCRLKHGADASLQDADGQTALHKAARQVLCSALRMVTLCITLRVCLWWK